MSDDNLSGRIRVNISIPVETHQRLKAVARSRKTNVSQLITELVRDHFGETLGMIPTPTWPQKIPLDALDRIELYAQEHHTSPEQAVCDWIWKAKVSDKVMKGQLSFR